MPPLPYNCILHAFYKKLLYTQSLVPTSANTQRFLFINPFFISPMTSNNTSPWHAWGAHQHPKTLPSNSIILSISNGSFLRCCRYLAMTSSLVPCLPISNGLPQIEGRPMYTSYGSFLQCTTLPCIDHPFLRIYWATPQQKHDRLLYNPTLWASFSLRSAISAAILSMVYR